MTTKQICFIWDLAVPEYPLSLLSQKSRKDAIVRHRRAFMEWGFKNKMHVTDIAEILKCDRTSVLYIRDSFKTDTKQVQLEREIMGDLCEKENAFGSAIARADEWQIDAVFMLEKIDAQIEALRTRKAQIESLFDQTPF